MTQYIYGNDERDDEPVVVFIRDFNDVADEFNVEVYEESPWCYLIQITGFPLALEQEDETENLLNFVVNEYPNRVFQLSVTSDEHGYPRVLDAVSGVPGASIVPLNRGDYTTYLCTFSNQFDI